MMHTRTVSRLMLTALLLAAPPANAQDASTAGAATEAPCSADASRETDAAEIAATARRLDREGLAFLAAGKWPEAHTMLLAAWSIHRHPQIALHVGLVKVVLGKYGEAAEPLTFYVEEVMIGIMRPAPAPKVSRARSARSCPSVEALPGITHIEGAPVF